MTFSRFSLILWGLNVLLRYCAWRYEAFAERLKEKSFTAQMKTADGTVGRWFRFSDGKVTSGAGIDPDAEVVLSFKNAKIAADHHGREIAIWGGNLDRSGLEVEWNGQRHAGRLFALTLHPANEVTLRIPTSIALPLGVHTLRLYDPASRAYSNPVKLIVGRATAAPAIQGSAREAGS